jgi:TolB-like protein
VVRATPVRRRSTLIVGAIALALAVVAGAMVWRGKRPSALARTRIATAVFVNRTGDPALDPFGSMAADWITRGLTQTALAEVVDVGAVYVQGRSAGGEPTDPFLLARRNGAGTVVSGSYYLATDSLFVRAAIVDANTGAVLQSVEPVRAPSNEPIKALELLQQQVMAAIAGVLDVRYTTFTARPSAPPNFAAYQSFVAGQTAYWQGQPASEAGALFRRAAAADSNFLTAAVWLAFVGANGAGCGLTDSVSTALAQRREALTPFDRLTLDLSVAKCGNDWNEGFRLAMEQAQLKPRSTYAVYTAGFFALISSRFGTARDLLRSIDPERDLGWLSDTGKSVFWRDLAGADHFLGRYKEELQDARRQIEAFPSRLAPHLIAARALAALGRSGAALAEVDTATQLQHDPTVRVTGGLTPGLVSYLLAAELLVHGDSAAALAAAQRAVDWYGQDPEHRLEEGRFERLYLARSLYLLGRDDEALAVAAFASLADSTDLHYLGLRGVLAAKQGRADEARAIEARLAAIGTPGQITLAELQRARVATALGETERAIALLQAAASGGFPRATLGNDIHSDPFFHPLRGDSRFEAVNRPD